MRTLVGCRSTNAFAAALAASIRVGATSVAAMLPDTSNARITVPSKRGTPTHCLGSGEGQAEDQRTEHEQRTRDPDTPPSGAAERAGRGPGRDAAGAADRRRRDRRDLEPMGHEPPTSTQPDPAVREHAHGYERDGQEHHRPDEGHRSGPPHPAARRDPHDRPDQVLVRRDRHRIDARPSERQRQCPLARRDGRREALAGSPGRACRRTAARRSRRPRPSSVPTSGSSSSRGSTEPDREHLVAAG